MNALSTLSGLTLPLEYKYGSIYDARGKEIIKANRDSLTTSLNPAGRDAILQLTVYLLNEALISDKADIILESFGY